MALDAEAHTLVPPFSRRNSEDSVASLLSDAETQLLHEDPLCGGALQLYNLRRMLLGLDSAPGADNESEEGVEDDRSAQSDCSSDGEDEGHSWTDSWTMSAMSTASTDHDVADVLKMEFGLAGLHEGQDVSLTTPGAVVWI